MYKVEKEWKTFNISLDALADQLKIDFPASATDPEFIGIQAMGDSADGEVKGRIEIYFDKEVGGYGKDENGNITTEVGSKAEVVETLWNAVDETHVVATSYVSGIALEAAVARAREDAPTKTYDLLSVEQKKLIAGATITLADKQQMLIDFP